MKSSKASKSKVLFNLSAAALLTAAIATASMMSGCSGCSNSETGAETETKVITETEVVTRIVGGVYTDEEGNILRDDDGNPITAPEDAIKAQSSANSGSSSSQSSNEPAENVGSKITIEKSESSEGSGSKSSSSSSKSDSSKSSSSSKSGSKTGSESSKVPSSSKSGSDKKSTVLTMDGNKFNVGDTIVCTYYVSAPEELLNYQATLYYDGNCVKVNNAKLVKPASSGAVINYKLDNEIKFNGSNLSGYDLYNSEFLTVEYEVISGGTANTGIDWEVAHDLNSKSYVSNGELTNGMTCTYEYKVK